MIPYSQLPNRSCPRFNSLNEFRIAKRLGQGAFAEVFEATSLISGEKFAVKKFKISQFNPEDRFLAFNEVQVMSSIRSGSSVKLVDFFEEKQFLVLVLELVEGGSLFENLYQKNKVTDSEIPRIFGDVARGISELHRQGLLYRDLKPENLVMDLKGGVKIIDFGWACKITNSEFLKAPAGTLAYMSPEMLRGETQDEKADVWGLGVLLFELYFRREPFPARDEEHLHEIICSKKPDYSNPKVFLSPEVERMIRKMLVPERQMRASMGEVLEFASSQTPSGQPNLNCRNFPVSLPDFNFSKSKCIDQHQMAHKAPNSFSNIDFATFQTHSSSQASLAPLSFVENNYSSSSYVPLMNSGDLRVPNQKKPLHQEQKLSLQGDFSRPRITNHPTHTITSHSSHQSLLPSQKQSGSISNGVNFSAFPSEFKSSTSVIFQNNFESQPTLSRHSLCESMREISFESLSHHSKNSQSSIIFPSLPFPQSHTLSKNSQTPILYTPKPHQTTIIRSPTYIQSSPNSFLFPNRIPPHAFQTQRDLKSHEPIAKHSISTVDFSNSPQKYSASSGIFRSVKRPSGLVWI